MKSKAVFLTFFLIIGFSFLRCNNDNCGDYVSSPYFDIQDVAMTNFIYESSNELTGIGKNRQVSKNETTLIFLDYSVEYHAQTTPHEPFSITHTAYGCTPLEDGHAGSKDEILENLTIVTLNDFDANHLANDTINDLFRVPSHEYYQVFVGTGETLNTFLTQNTAPIKKEDLFLELLQKPTLNDTFQVKIMMELSTDEVYEMESLPFVFY